MFDLLMFHNINAQHTSNAMGTLCTGVIVGQMQISDTVCSPEVDSGNRIELTHKYLLLQSRWSISAMLC